MFNAVNLENELTRLRKKGKGGGEALVAEAREILRQDLFTEKKILDHLQHYQHSFFVLDEEDVETEKIFSEHEIRNIAVQYRLKFLNADLFTGGLPHTAELMIRSLNLRYRKELREIFVLASPEAFTGKGSDEQAIVFSKTAAGNFYMIDRWGKAFHWGRRAMYWPLRSFESMIATIFVFTLLITLLLPTHLITLDNKAGYWCGYRAAAFFHLLIFNTGCVVYFTFAFSRNFSSSIWNSKTDFG